MTMEVDTRDGRQMGHCWPCSGSVQILAAGGASTGTILTKRPTEGPSNLVAPELLPGPQE